jgi:integrase
MAKRLTDISVKNAKPKAHRYEMSDGGCRGLYLVIQPSGAKSWAFRYRFDGQPKKLTLGPVYLGEGQPERAEIGRPNKLAGAHKLASEAAHQVGLGIDPAQVKHQRRTETRQAAEKKSALDRDTVEAVAREFIEKYARPNTRARSWIEAARIIGLQPDPADDTKLIRTKSGGEVLSRWGSRNIRDISTDDVNGMLDAIMARGKTVLANRTLAHVRKMFNWAVKRRFIAVSPCAGVDKPSKETSRDRVLTDNELRLVWRAAERIDWPFGPVVQMLILTCQRRQEVAGMHRAELHGRSWIISKERTKNGKAAHEVPLSPAALALLDGLHQIGRSGFVFTATGDAAVRGFNSAVVRLNAAVTEMNGEQLPHWTLHDLRRTAATGMARLGVQQPVVEKILNHTGGSLAGVAGIYNQHTYADEKRAALEKWAGHVLSLVQ